MILSISVILLLAAVLATLARLRRPSSVVVGLDIVEVSDVVRALESPRRERYLRLVYTDVERRDCTTASGVEASRLAARFAAKEAVWKTLGAPAGASAWLSVEVAHGTGGEPRVVLHDEAATAASRLGLRRFSLSLSHEPGHAAAVVVATG
ncbi:MAG TPA: holo-ACP synthase [Gaiellaceae bacterium]|jgi:holo-[acyl-carrier protein] synthase|nr:holo-ACP synthase [Gaiellaceae bacterium]